MHIPVIYAMPPLFSVSFAWIERDIRYYRPQLDLKYQLTRKLSFFLLWHSSENGEQNISRQLSRTKVADTRIKVVDTRIL